MADGYVTIQVRFPQVVLARLNQALTVRSMSMEGASVIEAFLGRVLEDVAAGGGTHEYKSGSITTTVLEKETT